MNGAEDIDLKEVDVAIHEKRDEHLVIEENMYDKVAIDKEMDTGDGDFTKVLTGVDAPPLSEISKDLVKMFDTDTDEDDCPSQGVTVGIDTSATPKGDVKPLKRVDYGSDESLVYSMVEGRKWYDATPTITMMREVRFPNRIHPAELGRGRPWSYEMPLFQQMREMACKKVSLGIKRGVMITNENHFYTSELVKAALLSHDKSRLTMTMLPLCFLPEKCAEMLWKVGSAVLSSNPCLEKDREAFHKWMEKVCKHDHLPEVVMDTVSTTLSSHGNVQEAYEIATEAISQERMLNDVYFNVYYGCLEYLLWKLERERLANTKAQEHSRRNWGGDEEDEEEEAEEEDESYARGNPLVAFHGHRSIKYLSRVEELQGTWDLVLPKYIDLLTFYEGRNDAIDALCKHLENNPNNPNSYAFYLHYVTDDSANQGLKRLHVLEDYCALDPTNERGKELLTAYMKAGSYSDCFRLLMNRLDHQACFNSFYDWDTLHMLLQMRHHNNDIQTFVDDHLRGSSWSCYHFPVPLDQVNRRLDDEVLQLKSTVAHILNRGAFAESVDTFVSSKQSNNPSDTDLSASNPITISVSLSASAFELDNDDELDCVSSPEILGSEDSHDDDLLVEIVLDELIDRVVASEEVYIAETSMEEREDPKSSFIQLLPNTLQTQNQIYSTCNCPVFARSQTAALTIRRLRRKKTEQRKLAKERKLRAQSKVGKESLKQSSMKSLASGKDIGDATLVQSKFPSDELINTNLSSDEEDNRNMATTTGLASSHHLEGGDFIVKSYLDKVVKSRTKRRWSSSSSSTSSGTSLISSDTEEEHEEEQRRPSRRTPNIAKCLELSTGQLDASQQTPDENIEPAKTYISTPNTKLTSRTLKSVKKRLTNSLAVSAAAETPKTTTKRGRLKEDKPAGPSSEPMNKRKRANADSDDDSLYYDLRTPLKKVLRQQNPDTSTKRTKKKKLSGKAVNKRRRSKKVAGELDYKPPEWISICSPSPAAERRMTRQRTTNKVAKEIIPAHIEVDLTE